MRALILLLSLGLAAIAPAAAPAEPAKAQAELQQITRKLNALDTWLGAADRRRLRLLRELESRDREVATVSASVSEAAAKVVEAEQALAALEAESDRLKAQRARQARHIADHLTAAYRLGGEDFFKLILNQQSPETFDRMIRYHRYFSEARVATLQDYQRTLEQMETNASQLRARAEEAAQLRSRREARQIALDAERNERKTLIATLDAEVEDKAIERERLLADRKRLETLLAELQRRTQSIDGRAFAQVQGKLPWPVDGRIVHGFGQKRAEGQMTWNGIVVAADDGTSIKAVHRGRVVFADWLRGFGMMTIIDHGSGYMTLYGQADALSKRVGEWVEGGETIGQVGRSGGQKDSGLYFEVRHNGRARDPAAWLAKR
jgi:septal ring factor EnvC (AmiA/AmiB activator)